MLDFSVRLWLSAHPQVLKRGWQFNLHLRIHRLQVQYAAIDEKRHTAVLAVSQMTEAERLVRQTTRCGLPLIN
jgi:hypothetical protein